MLKIVGGERPERPQDTGLTDVLWDMTRACWRQDPAHRPAMAGVVGTLRAGIPEEVHQLFKHIGISTMEQEKNLQAVMGVARFNKEGWGGSIWDKMGVIPSPTHDDTADSPEATIRASVSHSAVVIHRVHDFQ